jgi:transposase
MSTTRLYHNQGLRSAKYVSQGLIEKKWRIKCEIKPKFIVCPECKTSDILLRGNVIRNFIGVPECTRKVTIECKIPIVSCPYCNIKRQVNIQFADKNKTYTKKLAAFIIQEANDSSIMSVSRRFKISWDICNSIYIEYLKKKYSKPELKNLKYLAIDEIAVSKGHSYLTVVMNYETRRVIYDQHVKTKFQKNLKSES